MLSVDLLWCLHLSRHLIVLPSRFSSVKYDRALEMCHCGFGQSKCCEPISCSVCLCLTVLSGLCGQGCAAQMPLVLKLPLESDFAGCIHLGQKTCHKIKSTCFVLYATEKALKQCAMFLAVALIA